jgi:FkbM family methyltransferase
MLSWGRVIAIDAQERIYYALAGNIGLNNCFNARAIHAAQGAEAGTLKMPRPDYNCPASFGSLELRPSARNENIGQAIHYEEDHCDSVQLLPIDAFAPQRVDFIKLDVEGMELEVLAGAKQTIERNKPQMLIEIIKTDKQAVIRCLESQDYKVLEVGINALAIHMQDPAINSINIAPAAA